MRRRWRGPEEEGDVPGRANGMGEVERGLGTVGGELSGKWSVTVSVRGIQMGKRHQILFTRKGGGVEGKER